MSDKILQLNDQNFSSKITETNDTFLIDFWASWCAPCKMISVILDEIINEYINKLIICKIDIDHNPITAKTYNVRSIPTLLLLKSEKVLDKRVGVLSKNELKTFIDKYV